MRALVTGASGSVGGRLVPAFVERGHDIRALVWVRDETGHGVPDVAEGGLSELGGFEAALIPSSAACYFVHSMRAGEDFEERNGRAAPNCANAASNRGGRRVVYLGGLGEGRDAFSTHLRSRREIERILAGGDYALTMLRAATGISVGSASSEMMRHIRETPVDEVVRRGLARRRDA